jgi:hypothetical protein
MAEELGFDFRQGEEIFLFPSASRPALWPTQPPIRWVSVAFSPGVKRQGNEADHSPSSAGLKIGGAILPLLHTSSWRGTLPLPYTKLKDVFNFMIVTNRLHLILCGGRYKLLDNWEVCFSRQHYPHLSGVELSPVMRQDTV